MIIGFLLWVVGGLVVAGPLSILMYFIARALTRGRPDAHWVTGCAALLPFALWLYLPVALFLQAAWLDARGLSQGQFDVYKTPLGHGFYATSIDTPSPVGILEGPGVPQGVALNLIPAVQRAGCAGSQVVLDVTVGGQRRFARLGSGSPVYQEYPTAAALAGAVGGPIRWNPTAAPPAECAPRGDSWDTVVDAWLLGLPLGALAGLVWWVSRVRRAGIRSPT